MRGLVLALILLASPVRAAQERVDLALVLAVDVSESIDSSRYTLQMQGLANALASADVQASMLSGPHRSMLIAVVQWSNRPHVTLPWTLLTSKEDVGKLSARLRAMKRADEGFTCMSVALRSIADKMMTQLPVPADRMVIDVSGDGADNCNPPEPVTQVRDDLIAAGVTLNGLPILEGDEADTLEEWYRDHVIGGPNAFLLPAAGFDDFERAIRRKFVTEISGVPCRGCSLRASR